MRIIVTLILTSILLITPYASANDSHPNPKQLIENLSNSLFFELKANPEIVNDNEKFKVLLNKELIPNLNIPYISLKILGNNLKRYKKPEIKSFIKEMKPYITDLFIASFKFYKSQELKIYYKKNKKTKNQRVKVDMIGKENTIQLMFSLKKNKKGQWQIYDFIAEGISMLDSKRSEFSSILRKGDMEKVIEIMNKKALSK